MVSEKELANLKKFTSTYQPANKGRKPSRLRKYIKDNGMSSQDVSLIIKNIILGGASEEDLGGIIQDNTRPMLVRLFVRAFLQDFKSGTLNNFETMMNRAFGAPQQNVNHTGGIKIDDMSREERREALREWIKNNPDFVQGCGYSAAGPAEAGDIKNV